MNGNDISKIQYENLILALGNNLSFEKIIGFHENNYFISDVCWSNRLNNYLNKEYQGGAIAISANIIEKEISVTKAICSGPPMLMDNLLTHWHKKQNNCFISLFVNISKKNCIECMQKN